jgi:HD-GYP domain-containing protein (c-di-GMP phosphodiesterase class II)
VRGEVCSLQYDYSRTHWAACEAFGLETLRTLERLRIDVRAEPARAADEVLSLVESMRRLLIEDADAVLNRLLNHLPEYYPYSQCLKTALLSLAMGMKLQWSSSGLEGLGAGSLLHDFGMLALPGSSSKLRRSLNQWEYREVTRHPLLVRDMMERIPDLPDEARLIACQMHERGDGSGYPIGTLLDGMHPGARVAAVADVYVALTSHRPHRTPFTPHKAMEKLLHGARLNLFDPGSVRGLLETLSLFPLGSRVELSDGTRARAWRASGSSYSHPLLLLKGSGVGEGRFLYPPRLGGRGILRAID